MALWDWHGGTKRHDMKRLRRESWDQLHSIQQRPQHHLGVTSLLQGRSLAPPAERQQDHCATLQGRSFQPPKACGGEVQRAPAAPHTQRFGRNQGAGCLGATQLMERLPARIWLLFQSKSPEQGKGDIVPEEVWARASTHVPAKTFTPSTAFTASLLQLSSAPRARVSKTWGHCQENLIQPTGGLLSAPLITHPTTTSQVLRPPERAGLTTPTPSRSAAPYLRSRDYFLL